MLALLGVLGLVAVGASVLMDVTEPDQPVETVGDVNDDEDQLVAKDAATGEGGVAQSSIEDVIFGPSTASAPDTPTTDPLAPETDASGDATGCGTGGDTEWDIVTGGEAAETLTGTDGSDFMHGYDGADQMSGGQSNDQIEGGAGDDTLAGDAGDDTLHGEAGDDLLEGGAGVDDLYGHSGDDWLEGGAGDDSLVGGQGDDTLDGGEGDDALHGYHGDDSLEGGAGADTLFGSEGNDTLSGLGADGFDDGARDYLNGGAGEDSITAGMGDVVTAGEGADIISLLTNSGAGDGDAAQVLDFEAGEDNLVLLYEGADEPDLEVEEDATQAGLYRVMMEGQIVANIRSDTPFVAQDISLVAQG